MVFSAHGVSPLLRADAARRGLNVLDATCPLVAKVHAEARRAAARGGAILLIGNAGHEEVQGTLGQAPERTILVESVADVAALEIPDSDRVSYLAQTTLALDETAETISALTARFPAATRPGAEDICYATINRQNAVAAVASEADLVLVVGSADSSNSVRLVELARRLGTRAHLIEDAAAIRPHCLEGAETIGISAGACAPQHLVAQVIEHLAALGPIQVTERAVTVETVRFAPPHQIHAGRHPTAENPGQKGMA